MVKLTHVPSICYNLLVTSVFPSIDVIIHASYPRKCCYTDVYRDNGSTLPSNFTYNVMLVIFSMPIEKGILVNAHEWIVCKYQALSSRRVW